MRMILFHRFVRFFPPQQSSIFLPGDPQSDPCWRRITIQVTVCVALLVVLRRCEPISSWGPSAPICPTITPLSTATIFGNGSVLWAHWASWADSVWMITERHPRIVRIILCAIGNGEVDSIQAIFSSPQVSRTLVKLLRQSPVRNKRFSAIFWMLNFWSPNLEKVGPAKGGAPEGGCLKFRVFPLPPLFSIFSSLSWGSFVEFWWCFWRLAWKAGRLLGRRGFKR